MNQPLFQRRLFRILVMAAVIAGLLECEAQALEWGLGAFSRAGGKLGAG